MARYKKNVKIDDDNINMKKKRIIRREDPISILTEHPTWSFSSYDKDGKWAFSKEHLCDLFWDSLLPKLAMFEQMTWDDILVKSKKQNHSIEVSHLNKAANDRLVYLGISQEEIVSLRLTGTLRLYGFISLSTFVILWVDDDHGDNDTCVCRSHKKHT